MFLIRVSHLPPTSVASAQCAEPFELPAPTNEYLQKIADEWNSSDLQSRLNLQTSGRPLLQGSRKRRI
jgi:hypothetical protein